MYQAKITVESTPQPANGKMIFTGSIDHNEQVVIVCDLKPLMSITPGKELTVIGKLSSYGGKMAIDAKRLELY